MNREFHVEKPTINDIKEMLELNYKIYPAEWHVSSDYVEKVMEKNPLVYNVLRTEEGIKGIVSIFPLEQESYELVLKGELDEKDIASFLVDYSTPKDIYLYLISLIVDIHDPRRKVYAKQIIQHIPKELKKIEESGFTIKEIGAIAISKQGRSVLPKIGFQQDQSLSVLNNQNEHPVFRASLEDVFGAIRIE